MTEQRPLLTEAEQLVQQQLDAYNSKNIEAWLGVMRLMQCNWIFTGLCWPMVMIRCVSRSVCVLMNLICMHNC